MHIRHKHIRLRGYDYGQAGAYYVTICSHRRVHLYGRVVDPLDLAAEPYMDLNDAGRLVKRCWDAIPGHYPHVMLDAFQVMPDHVHAIIVITEPPMIVSSRHAATTPTKVPSPHGATTDITHAASDGLRDTDDPGGSEHAPTQRISGKRGLANIVGSFKSAITKGVNELRGTPGAPVWQKGYYEHIIRDGADHDRIALYIAENPAKWAADRQCIVAACRDHIVSSRHTATT